MKEENYINLFVLVKGCLSYMVISDGEAAIIDAVRFTDVFINFAKQKGVEIKHVFDTHLHADHISGGRHIAAETECNVLFTTKRCKRSNV